MSPAGVADLAAPGTCRSRAAVATDLGSAAHPGVWWLLALSPLVLGVTAVVVLAPFGGTTVPDTRTLGIAVAASLS